MKKLILLILLFPLFIRCQNKEINTNDVQIKTTNSNKDMIEQTLKQQLLSGAEIYLDEPGVEIPKEEFTENEFEVSILLMENILESQGYKFPSQSEFNEKIKLILNRVIDSNSDKKYLYVNLFDKCDREFNHHPYNGVEYNGVYILKNQRFISKFYFIPEIIDYQKEYSEIAKVENIMPLSTIKYEQEATIYPWKDMENHEDAGYNLKKRRRFNQLLLVSRNRYLFNDDKSKFVWLTHNDEDFMESLVKTFGYTEDKKLLKWVVERNISSEEKLREILISRDCQGKLEIRKEVLEELKERFLKNQKIEEILLLRYISSQTILDKNNEYTEQEQMKVIAYLASIYDPIYKKDRYKYDLGSLDILADYMYSIGENSWEKVKKEYARNNYYDLHSLKAMVDYAEQFDQKMGPLDNY